MKTKNWFFYLFLTVAAVALISMGYMRFRKAEADGEGNASPQSERQDKEQPSDGAYDGENAGQGEGQKPGGEDAAKPEYYVFQDVEDKEYRAELLDGMPLHSYDFSCLREDGATGYKSYADSLGVTAKRGIDVSEFQGDEIDWNAVRQSGMEFVIVRVGYRGYGNAGTLVKDAMFEENVQGALAAGLQVGVYFFSQAITEEEALEEAQFVLDLIRPFDIQGPVVFDTEEIKYDTARTDGNTREQFTAHCRVFCDRVKQAGYDTMIYANMKWMAFTLNLLELKDYDFWFADYHDVPQCPYDFKIWQYSETGAVPGINGNVDLNLWFQ